MSKKSKRVRRYNASLEKEAERADMRHARTTQFLRRQVTSYQNGSQPGFPR